VAGEAKMHDWNVVVTVHEGGFSGACRLLGKIGPVSRTEFFNVLVMRAEDINALLERLRELVEREPGILNDIARLIPLQHVFNFQSPETFEEKAAEIVSRWVPVLADKSFHVRMRRRGFKGRLSSMDEERFLDDRILEALEKEGSQGRIVFENPDFIIAVESVGTRAGLSLWSRDELRRYEFLKTD
jgi:tRNA(Ser,Leu) C12 N-acetylase TAN1